MVKSKKETGFEIGDIVTPRFKSPWFFLLLEKIPDSTNEHCFRYYDMINEIFVTRAVVFSPRSYKKA